MRMARVEADRLGPQAISEIIDDIYRCVLDRTHWVGVLERLTPFVGCCAASLNVHDLTSRTPELLVEVGTRPEASQSYLEVYGAINPLIDATLLYLGEGEVRTLYDTVDLAEYQCSRFYREWVAPQGWGDWMGCLLVRRSTSLAMLSLARLDRDGPYLASEVERMRLFMPHVQRATMLGRLFEHSAAERAGMATLVDRIRVAAFLVEPSGRISFVNRLGEALLADGLVLRESNRMLTALDSSVQKMLTAALTGDAGTPQMTLVATQGGKRVLSILPPSDESGGYAVVMVATPEAELPLPGPMLAQAYGLTMAEIRVLTALLKRGSLGQIAVDLGVTQRTVRAHLQKLFEKTGTRRQSDLIAEVLALAPPMRMF